MKGQFTAVQEPVCGHFGAMSDLESAMRTIADLSYRLWFCDG